MLGLKVEFKWANKAKLALLEKNVIDLDYLPLKDTGSITFPLINLASESDFNFLNKNLNINFELDEFNFNKKKVKLDFKSEVLKILPDHLHSKLYSSYDILGDIAIIEVNKDLIDYQINIAEILLSINTNIKTVLKKKGGHKGELRLQNYEYLAGVENKHALVKENGITISFDIEKAYYSIRSSNERKRIYKQVKINEKVLIFFSGIGPYSLSLAKNSFPSLIVNCEFNKYACEIFLNSLKENKLNDIGLEKRYKKYKKLYPELELLKFDQFCGNICDFADDIFDKYNSFDRIIMPLPHTANEYLSLALKFCKTGSIIHLYDFGTDESIDLKISNIKNKCKEIGFNVKILDIIKCGQFSSDVNRFCFDILIK